MPTPSTKILRAPRAGDLEAVVLGPTRGASLGKCIVHAVIRDVVAKAEAAEIFLIPQRIGGVHEPTLLVQGVAPPVMTAPVAVVPWTKPFNISALVAAAIGSLAVAMSNLK